MLEGRKINLRLMTKEDVEEFVRQENIYKERGEFLPPIFHSLAERMKRFDEKKGWWDENEGALVMETKQGEMLGIIGFFTRDLHLSGYELGYGILKKQNRGRGYVSEALRILSAYLFELKPIPRIYLLTHSENAPSRRVAEKCGFTLEGTLRKAAFVRGAYADLVCYSLLREDCPPLRDVLP